MTIVLSGVRPGWKVFARAAEVGTVETVANGDLYFRRGRLIQHRYRVPAEYVETTQHDRLSVSPPHTAVIHDHRATRAAGDAPQSRQFRSLPC